MYIQKNTSCKEAQSISKITKEEKMQQTEKRN